MSPLRFLGMAVSGVAILFSVETAVAAGSEKPTSEATTIRQLQRSIKKRDALIHDLLRRVERLERETAQRRPRVTRVANPAGNEARPVPVAVDGNRTPQAVPERAAAAPEKTPAAPETAPAGQSAEAAPSQPPAKEAEAAPGQFSVSPEAAEHALERALVQTGALLLPKGTVELVPSFTYQFQQFTRPDQIALGTNGNILVTEDVLRSTTAQAGLLARIGLPWDSQLEVGIPYVYKNLTTANRVLGSGIVEHSIDAEGNGDPQLTLTKQVLKEGEWLPSVFASGTWNADLGQTVNNIPLGAGFHEFAFGLSATKRQDPLVFTAGFSYLTALSHDHTTPGNQFTPSLGMLLAVSPETSLRVSQQLTFADKLRFNDRLIPGSQQISGIFTFGLLSILAPGLVVDLSASVGETPDAPDLTVRLALPIRLN